MPESLDSEDGAGRAFADRIAAPAEIGRLLTALDAHLRAAPAPPAQAERALLVVEELIANAFLHGGAEATGGVEVALSLRPGARLEGEIRHRGPAFDPASDPASDPDVDPGAQSDPAADPDPDRIGGQGLRLIRAFTAALSHAHAEGLNRVRFDIAPD